MTSVPIDQRISGGLLGLLVGDALGVPYEFFHPGYLPKYKDLEMVPPASFRRSHARTPPGTYSDDGAQALCLAKSLIENGRLDVDDFGSRLLRWFKTGYYAVDGRVFDCGAGTKMAFERMTDGVPAKLSGGDADTNNGNGSLMRVLPLALWHRGSLSELVTDAHTQSLPTHRHPVSQVCCAMYCLIARDFLHGKNDVPQIWSRAETFLAQHYDGNRPFTTALDTVLDAPFRKKPEGKGYVVDSLWSAYWALQQGSYEKVVKKAVELGHDTDTSACIAGGLAGVRDGILAIPERWLHILRGSDWYAPLLAALTQRERDLPVALAESMADAPVGEVEQFSCFDSPNKGLLKRVLGLFSDSRACLRRTRNEDGSHE